MPFDLVQLSSDVSMLGETIRDPASGPASLQGGLAAVRTLTATDGHPGPPAPNLELLAPGAGVPRPQVSEGQEPGGTVSPVDLGVVGALPVAGPTGPPGETGPAGPPGPQGPGIHPERFRALEAAVADLQMVHLLDVIVGSQFGGT